MKEAMSRLMDITKHLKPVSEASQCFNMKVVIATPYRHPMIYRMACVSTGFDLQSILEKACESAWLNFGLLSKDGLDEAKSLFPVILDRIYTDVDKCCAAGMHRKIRTNVTLTHGTLAYMSVIVEPVYKETVDLSTNDPDMYLGKRYIKVSIPSDKHDEAIVKEGSGSKAVRVHDIPYLILTKLCTYFMKQDPNTREFFEALEALNMFLAMEYLSVIDMNKQQSFSSDRSQTHFYHYDKLKVRVDLF